MKSKFFQTPPSKSAFDLKCRAFRSKFIVNEFKQILEKECTQQCGTSNKTGD